jgi:hypothetical protein
LIRKGKISVEVTRVLGRIQRALDSSGQLDKLPKMGPKRDDFQEVFPGLGSLQDDGEPTIDSLLCVGLIIYGVLEFSDLPVWQTLLLFSTPILELRGGLTLQLLSCERLRDVEEEACLQWLCLLTIGSCKDRSQMIADQGSELLEVFQARYPNLEPNGEFFELKQTQFNMAQVVEEGPFEVERKSDYPEKPAYGNGNMCQLLTIGTCWQEAQNNNIPSTPCLQKKPIAS